MVIALPHERLMILDPPAFIPVTDDVGVSEAQTDACDIPEMVGIRVGDDDRSHAFAELAALEPRRHRAGDSSVEQQPPALVGERVQLQPTRTQSLLELHNPNCDLARDGRRAHHGTSFARTIARHEASSSRTSESRGAVSQSPVPRSAWAASMFPALAQASAGQP